VCGWLALMAPRAPIADSKPSPVILIDTDDSELVCKLAGLHQVAERRYRQTLGQIPPAPKITRVADGTRWSR
jgi:hypothetical protein